MEAIKNFFGLVLWWVKGLFRGNVETDRQLGDTPSSGLVLDRPSGEGSSETAKKEKEKERKPFAERYALAQEMRELYVRANPSGLVPGRRNARWVDSVAWYVKKIEKSTERYKVVQDETEVPWKVIASIHSLESGLSFDGCLHNGDPLHFVTTNVPKGIGPFNNWEESAVDALMMKENIFPEKWTIGETLDFIERYNGLGYRNMRKQNPEKHGDLQTPYLWSGCGIYRGGKFIADHKFSKTAWSKQVGAALILKGLNFKGEE